jgi:hypothetical protein
MVGVGLLSLLVTGCRDRSGTSPAPPSEEAEPAAVSSARRPARRYYLGRILNRCEIFWVDGAEVSPPTLVACPLDLQPGERIRIAGKTCMREGSDPARHEPVVCPGDLTLKEQDDRESLSKAP